MVIPKWRRGYYKETYEEDLMKHKINDFVDMCHKASFDAGWWADKDGNDTRTNPLTFSNKLMLIVSEIAEAMEGDRKDCPDDKLPHRDMREVELADAMIRIGDLAGAYNMNLGAAVVEKMAYNATRSDHKKENRASVGGKSY
jgi:NTP pyrophosphatase (non-canonical NTP hydrolase)